MLRQVRIVEAYMFKSSIENLEKPFRGPAFWRI